MAQLAKRYATALFDLAVENQSMDMLFDEVSIVLESMQDDDFNAVFHHPEISYAEKLNFVRTVFSNEMSDELMGLFAVVLQKRREKEISDILNTFLDLCNQFRGKVTAKVISAYALPEDTLQKIAALLSRNMQKTVAIDASVDPSLIGGLRIEACGTVIDGTIKNNLQNLKNSLMSLQLT